MTNSRRHPTRAVDSSSEYPSGHLSTSSETAAARLDLKAAYAPRADVVDVLARVHALVEDLARLAATLAGALEPLEIIQLVEVWVVLEAWPGRLLFLFGSLRPTLQYNH